MKPYVAAGVRKAEVLGEDMLGGGFRFKCTVALQTLQIRHTDQIVSFNGVDDLKVHCVNVDEVNLPRLSWRFCGGSPRRGSCVSK
jgi:hypothetical protein